MKRLSILLLLLSLANSRAQLLPNGGFELGDRTQVANATWQGQLNPATALPSWGLTSPLLFYNNRFLDSSGAWFGTTTFSAAPYQGQYALVIQAGWTLNGPDPYGPHDFSLFQNVSIPATSQSITFRGKSVHGLPATVMLGGQSRSPVFLGSNGGYDLFAVDARDFSGTTAELRFTVSQYLVVGSTYQYYDVSTYALDDVRFSTIIVPEPSVLVLFIAGAAAFARRSKITSPATSAR